MKKIMTLAFLALLTGLSAGYASAQTATQQRTVTDFNAIRVSNGIDIYLTQGNTDRVEVTAPGDIIGKLKTEVEDGVLKIYLEKGANTFHHNGNMRVNVSFRQIHGVEASGGSDVYIRDGIDGERLAFSLSGGSNLKGRVSARELALSLSGGSDADLSGKTGTVAIQENGGSNVKAYDLVTDNCNVENGGGSDVYITVNRSLNVSASGGSDVYYKGGASATHISASGGSEVKKS